MRIHGLTRAGLAAFAVVVGLLCSSGSALAAEAPVTREAKSITGTTAVLHGVLNPKAKVAEAVEYQFAYAPSGSECTGGPMAPLTPLSVPGNPGEAVSETLAGLEGSTEYTFCLVANPPGEAPLSGSPSTFKTLPAAPEVDSVSSSGVTPFEATVEALVNPENQQSTSCVFEYGTSTAYGHSVPCAQPVLEGGGDTGASAMLTGLKGASPTTTYHYRVVVKNATGEVKSSDGEFTTLEAVKPAVESEGSSGVTPLKATLEAQVNPEFQETKCEFVYGTDPTLTTGTTTTPCEPPALGEGGSPVGATLPLSGLTPNTSYYFRVVATNATGTQEGTITEVKTLALKKPEVESEGSSGVTPSTATLEAQVNPEYGETKCEFVYGTDPTLTTGTATTSCEPAALGEGGGAVGATLPLSALTPNTPYFFHVVATNVTGKTEGAIREVKTLPLEKPGVENPTASPQTPFAETLEAQVNPNFQPTSCRFEYGLTTAYTTSAPCNPATLEGDGPQGVSLSLTELKPDTKYHFRVVAHNATGETEGTGEFTTQTAEAPSVDSESSSRLSSTGVTLEAQVNPNYQATTYVFEYATTESLLLEGHGTSVPGGSIPAGFGDQLARVVISRGTLAPGTTYFYRVVATNTAGTTAGMPTVEHFKTLIPPTASTGATEMITPTTATVSGTVNPEGQDTHVGIEYGPTTGYGQSTIALLDAGAGTTSTPTGAIELTTLHPGTTYHYRLIAINSNNETAAGEDRQFTTAAPAPPAPTLLGNGSGETPPSSTPAPTPSATTFPNLTAVMPLPAPQEPTGGETPSTKSLTNAQKLAKALKACKKKPKGAKRSACEAQAKKQAQHKKNSKSKTGKRAK